MAPGLHSGSSTAPSDGPSTTPFEGHLPTRSSMDGPKPLLQPRSGSLDGLRSALAPLRLRGWPPLCSSPAPALWMDSALLRLHGWPQASTLAPSPRWPRTPRVGLFRTSRELAWLPLALASSGLCIGHGLPTSASSGHGSLPRGPPSDSASASFGRGSLPCRPLPDVQGAHLAPSRVGLLRTPHRPRTSHVGLFQTLFPPALASSELRIGLFRMWLPPASASSLRPPASASASHAGLSLPRRPPTSALASHSREGSIEETHSAKPPTILSSRNSPVTFSLSSEEGASSPIEPAVML